MGNQLAGNVALDNAEHARQALARGDLAQALFHISSALSTEPQNGAWRAFIDDVIARTPDPMVFVRPDEAKADFITAATRAYIQAKKGQHRDAFVTIFDVAAARPDCAFLLWAVEWAAVPGAVESIDAETLEKALVPRVLSFLGRCPSPTPLESPLRKNVDACATVLESLYRAHPQSARLVYAVSMVLRRQGQFDAGIQFATYANQLAPTWSGAIGVAAAYRDAKRVDEAAGWYRQALAIDPSELAACLDLGDTYLDADRFDDAATAYRAMLAGSPNDGWARASLAYTAFRKSESEADFEALFAMIDQNQRARELYFRIVGDQPFFTWLPHPGDSTYHAAKNIVANLRRKAPPATLGIDVHLKHMEAPSAIAAFQLFTRAKGWQFVGLAPKIESVQEPDTRRAKGPVDFVLWAFDDKVPRPNCPNPDPRVWQAIAAIASRPYSLTRWSGPARELAAQMGPAWVNQLLFAMVNPPPLPSPEADPFSWLQKCQLAIALVVGFIDGGWEGSVRKRTLESVAMGPVDWVVDAAVVVMGFLAKHEPAIRPAVEAFFANLERTIPKTGFVCFEYPLVNTWLNLGGHPPETQKRLELWKVRCESQVIEFAEEKHAGITLEQYAALAAERDAILLRGGAMGGVMAAMGGGGDLAMLCAKYGVPALPGGMAGRVPAWDQRINADPQLQRRFVAAQQKATLAAAGIDPNSHEGRVAQQIQSGGYDVNSQVQNAQAAAQAIERGEGGDPDPLVFPGKKLAKLSDYVGLMKAMQTGDMNGALKKYGLDMGGYMQAAQAWGIKLASDPVLNAKFAKMMAG